MRLLKEVAMADSPQRPTLVLVSHALRLPPEVQRYSARFTLALPSEDELLAIVRDEATRWSERNRGARVRTDNRTLQQVVKNLRGLSHGEARSLARNVICDDGAITQEDLPELNKTKFQLLDLEGVLSFEYDTARFAEVGGLTNLKRWLGERQGAFIDGKAEDRPKGMLLVGVQGGGKSLAAKAVAGLWGCPCCAWTSPACTTSSSARPSATCGRRYASPSRWRHACCGWTRSRRAWPAVTMTGA